jgi:hypothetical protein
LFSESGDNKVSGGETELATVLRDSVCAVLVGLPPPPTPIISALLTSLLLFSSILNKLSASLEYPILKNVTVVFLCRLELIRSI